MGRLIDTEKNKFKVVCGALVVDGDSFVIVQEAKEHCYGQWNIPAGHSHTDENLFESAIREVKEETNLDIKLDGLLGIYQHKTATGYNVIKIVFKASKSSGELKFPKAEILDVKWVTFEDFMSIPIEALRTEELRTMVTDYKTRGVYYLEFIKTLGL